LFAQFDEFKEVDVMLRDRIRTYSEEAAEKAAELAKQEGINEGVKEGIAKLAKRLLADGVSPDVIARNSELPVDEVKALMN
jgi:predicted transposase/invertase (TIGR01784 family)